MQRVVSLWFVVVALLSCCRAELERVPATELVVRISAGPEITASLSTLRVRTAREQADGMWRAQGDGDRSFTGAELRWPVDIVIIPRAESQADAPLEVIVDAVGADAQVLVQVRSITRFVKRATRVLHLELARCGAQPLGFVCETEPDCLGSQCLACSDGVCGPVPTVAPEALSPFEPPPALDAAAGDDLDAAPSSDAGSMNADASRLDAALSDASERDAGERDASERDAGERDAGADAAPVSCGPGTRLDNALSCVDIDECADKVDNCDGDPTACVNLERAGFQCSCPSGWDGDGVGANGCVDRDECQAATPVCGTLVMCTNLPGSYQCGTCPSGYSVDASGNCQDVNECLSNNGGCDTTPMAQCMNQTGASNTCVCPAGYTGAGRGSSGCTNIDDCAPNPCVHGEACTDLVQDYSCACAVGYSGKTCALDVCSPSPCASGFNCTRTASGASCRPACATTASRCAAGQQCATTADCGAGLTCDNTAKVCLQTCEGPITVTSRASLADVRFCAEVQGDLVLDAQFATLAATDLPYLTSVTGTLRDSFGSGLTALELPALRTVGSLALSTGGVVLLPSLTQAGNIEMVFLQTRIELPVLTSVSNSLHVGSATNLTRIDLRALTTIGGSLDLETLENLTSLNISSLNRVTGTFRASLLLRLPYSSVRRLHDSATGLDRVGGTITIEEIGCCLAPVPADNQFACSSGC